MEIIEVFKDIEFDAGHRVPNHKSKCRNPHGHRYKVRVGILGELVTTSGASNEGMLADFGDLKSIMMERIHDVLDHGFIVSRNDIPMVAALDVGHEFDLSWKVILFPYIPTAENLARWCWDQMKEPVEQMGFHLVVINVWETPTSIATYAKDPDVASE